MSRGGYRSTAGRKKGQKDTKPRKGSPAYTEAENIKKMLTLRIKAKAKIYQDFLVRVKNGDKLSIAEKRLMDKLGNELEAETKEKKTESGGPDLEAGEFLRKVWNDPNVDMSLRIKAAEVAHKESPKGKKDERADRAKQASQGKFAAGKAPVRLVK